MIAKVIQEEEPESLPSSLPDLEPPSASSPLSAISPEESALSPASSDMPSPVRPYPKRGIAAPSPLRQSTSRASRKRAFSPDTPEQVAHRSKAARRSSGRQNQRSTKEEIDAFMAGEDESVVEGLVDQDEDMTPIPDDDVAQQAADITLVAGKPRAAKDKAEEADDDVDEAEAVEDAEGVDEGEGEDDLYPPGTLGAYFRP
jgi:hypothetical protein